MAFRNAADDVVMGMLNGFGAASAIRKAALDQHYLELAQQQQRDSEQQQAQKGQDADLQHQMLMSSIGAKPVMNGAVVDSTPAAPGPSGAPAPALPSAVAGVSADPSAPPAIAPGSYGATPGAVPGTTGGQPFVRPVDKSRYVKRKNSDGSQSEYELPTMEEQQATRLRQAAAADEVENTAALNRLRQTNEANRVNLPGVGPVSPHLVPFYTDQANNERSAKNNAATIAAENARNANTVSAENQRAKDANASRERAAGTRAKGMRDAATLTPGQENVQNRADDKQYSDLLDSEKSLNLTRNRLGAAIKSGKLFIDKNGNAKSMGAMDDDERAANVEDMRQRFQGASDNLKDTVARKNDLIAKKGGRPLVTTEKAHAAIDAGTQALLGKPTPTPAVAAAPAAATPAAAAPAAGPKKGDKQNYRGAAYVFDGKEYVRQ